MQTVLKHGGSLVIRDPHAHFKTNCNHSLCVSTVCITPVIDLSRLYPPNYSWDWLQPPEQDQIMDVWIRSMVGFDQS